MFSATMLLLALQAGGAAPDAVHPCAPRRTLSAGGPPPPVFSAARVESVPEGRVDLAVERCPGGGYRVVRHIEGTRAGSIEQPEWVPVGECPALAGWIDAVGRLRLPAPMLTPYRNPTGRNRGTWFTLHARVVPASGRAGNLEMSILHPPGSEQSVLSRWIGEGERQFQSCRDRRIGGAGFAPFRRRLPQPPRPRS